MKIYIFFIFITVCRIAIAKFDWLDKPIPTDLYKKKRISIVFASQNLKSPVSMFGHTLLVAHDDMPPEPDALTIEFLGRTSDSLNLLISALFLKIDGEFHIGKFIFKKREYDFEDRDLWIYELNLTKNHKYQIYDKVISSLDQRVYDYTFLNKNCSFYIFNSVVENNNLELKSAYTLPKNTIRELKSLGYVREKPIILETDQTQLIKFIKSLAKHDLDKIKQILNGYSYSLHEESWNVRKGLELALIYKIPREPSSKKRNLYFNIKKQLLEVNQLNLNAPSKIKNPKSIDPVDTYGDANARLGYDLNSQSAFLEWKFAQRDFYTSKNDGLANSYLEIVKSKFHFNKMNIKIHQFTLFKLESLVPRGDYNEPFNRLVDLSFYSHQFDKNESVNETVLRFGHGLSLKKGDLTFGTIPYFGIRHFSYYSKSGSEFDFGFLTKFNFWLSETTSIESSVTNYLFTAMPMSYKSSFKLATRLNSRFTLGFESNFYENNHESELSIVYGF